MINALNSYRKNMDIAELLQVITDVIQKKHGLKIDIKPVIEKMAAITDEQIIDICAPLDSIYPQAVSIVFEEIIKHMRESSERFLFHDLD